jgi:LmbE family N-acetylglucosaminyl deacetylase
MSDNPYHGYISSLLSCYQQAASMQPSPTSLQNQLPVSASAPRVVILAPHPDDECVMGGLPLRLRREAGCKVITLPVTLGSNPQRKEERKKELQDACDSLGFSLGEIIPLGLDMINPAARQSNPENWKSSVNALVAALEKYAPSILFFPNHEDWNQTHLGVNLLTHEALQQIKLNNITLIETEFWGQMPSPNLLVESTTEEVADLVQALAFHRGEVERNPFHLRLPAWMQDNVRRGAEVIGGQGGEAPAFDFATPYRVSLWKENNLFKMWKGGKMLPSNSPASTPLVEQLSPLT